MTTREAVSLVLARFRHWKPRRHLAARYGEPVRILDLAKTLIRLSGKSEHEVGIRFTGLRDGEKLFEELSYPAEEIHPTPFRRSGRFMHTHRGDDLTRHLVQLRSVLSVNGAARDSHKDEGIVPEYCDGHDDLPEGAGILAGPDARANAHFLSLKRTSGNSTYYPATYR